METLVHRSGAKPAAAKNRLPGISMRELRAAASLLGRSLPPPRTAGEHLARVIVWLCRAQDATGTGGVSYGYDPLKGWWPAYPETTGYCIPTFLAYARRTDEGEYRARALAMAEWELGVQNPDGSIAGGPVQSHCRPGVAFDTGQVLQGLVAAYHETRQDRFLYAARRAGDWLVRNLDPSGAWCDRLVNGTIAPRAYNARTSWALLQLAETCTEDLYRDAASRNLQWVLGRQLSNGWFQDNAFVSGKPPLTHTITYVLEGLVESWTILRDERLLEAAVRGTAALCGEIEPDGSLRACFNQQWKSTDWYACVTGCAQAALVCFRLFQITADPQFLRAGKRLSTWVKTIQIDNCSTPEVDGGIRGSFPAYGAYERLRLPNWAAKFFADTMLVECELADASTAQGFRQ